MCDCVATVLIQYISIGRISYANENDYESDNKNGKKLGRGTLVDSKGNKYVGSFLDDNFNREGVMTYTGGNRYEGDFVNGKKYDIGTLKFAEGIKCMGSF